MDTHEDDDFVDSVNELRWEMAANCSHDQLFGLRFHRTFTHVAKISCAKITRHDDDSVPEIDHSALAVCQSTVIQDLQEKGDEFPASLLDLVYQHDAVGLATDIFC